MQKEIYDEYATPCCKSNHSSRAKIFENKLAKKEKEDKFTPLYSLLSDALHVFDIFTDLTLAKKMYDLSRQEMYLNGDRFVEDYNKCFVIIILATFGPYLI